MDKTEVTGIDIVAAAQTQHDEPDQDAEVVSIDIHPSDSDAVSLEHASLTDDAQLGVAGSGGQSDSDEHPHSEPTPGSVSGATEQEISEDHASEMPQEPQATSAEHLDPYLSMVGAGNGGNGGEHQASSDAASPYLDAVGATPDTAVPPPDDQGTDHAFAVPDEDPFAAGPDQTDDQVQAIEGTPGDEAPIEPLPVPDADLDPHQHG